MERIAVSVVLLWGWKRAALAILAGAVGALALAPLNLFAAMFVSFPLLVWLLDGATGDPGRGSSIGLRSAFSTGWCFGFGYFVAGLWWLGAALLVEADAFAWALPLAVLGLPALLAIFYGLAAALAKIFWSDGLGRVAALAAGFGLAEWLRSFVATGFPWNAIGYAAMPVPVMMQSSWVLGLLAVTTCSVFVFSAPALLGTRRGAAPGLTVAAILLVAHFGYGAYRLQTVAQATEPAEPLTVRLVQPAIDQAQKMENVDRIEIFERHLALTGAAPANGERRPDLVIWPETSVPFILTDNPDALVRIADVLSDGQILIAGAVRAEARSAGSQPRYFNSVYMIDDKGQILAAADKVHLTPFGEYLPFEGPLRAVGLEELISLPGGFSAAATRAVLTLPSGFGLYPLICYEVIFPGEISKDLGGANVILNITNDAWFGHTPGPYQHFQQARLRAVENGTYVLRDANNGISAVIDPFGRVISGLALGSSGAADAAIGGKSVPFRSIFDHNLNFWLVQMLFAVTAVISRVGFIRKMN